MFGPPLSMFLGFPPQLYNNERRAARHGPRVAGKSRRQDLLPDRLTDFELGFVPAACDRSMRYLLHPSNCGAPAPPRGVERKAGSSREDDTIDAANRRCLPTGTTGTEPAHQWAKIVASVGLKSLSLNLPCLAGSRLAQDWPDLLRALAYLVEKDADPGMRPRPAKPFFVGSTPNTLQRRSENQKRPVSLHPKAVCPNCAQTPPFLTFLPF